MKKRGWRGYVFSRPINGSMIPQRVQNLVLRTYAQKSGILYLLSATEYHMPGSFMMLESQYPDLKRLEGLLFYSLNMLPEKREQRRRLFDAILKARCGLRFALEELHISDKTGVTALEDLLACRRLSSRPPLEIPFGGCP
jgi:sporadic carbohydrate cluster protein (TIGR04323 family)